MGYEKEEIGKQLKKRELPRINLRPLLFCAAGLICGIFLYLRFTLGGFRPSDLIFPVFFLLAGLLPFSVKRALCVLLSFLVAAGVGVGLIHLAVMRYYDSLPSGQYEASGTVERAEFLENYSVVRLRGVSLDGTSVGGKLDLTLAGTAVRPGDKLRFTAEIASSADGFSVSERNLVDDVRYLASGTTEKTGASSDVFLLLNAKIYDVLHDNMEKDEADVSYALLTGNSGNVDEDMMTAFRKGGIAHIFAVSGLHIGILYAAVQTVCKRLRKFSFLPALALSLCYCALCGFSVSSLRAVVMSGAAGVWIALGRKTDFLSALSGAAIAVLALFPAQWLSAGFRLSFGACLGLALFSGSFSRAFRRLPKFLGEYLAANLSVQFFTFPILYETFGYFPVWSIFANLVLVPLLPVLFLGLLLCTVFALMIPPAASFFLMFPEGSVSLLLFVFAALDLSLAVTGFSLGAGGTVWLFGSVGLSQRVRLSKLVRTAVALASCIVLGFSLLVRNVVFDGCKISVADGTDIVFLQSAGERVLVIGDTSVSQCESFLARNYGGTLDAVVVAGEDVYAALNVAAFLPSREIYAAEETETGLHAAIRFADDFHIGSLYFRYETPQKLLLSAEEVSVELDFANSAYGGTDLFLGREERGLIFHLVHGIIKSV